MSKKNLWIFLLLVGVFTLVSGFRHVIFASNAETSVRDVVDVEEGGELITYEADTNVFHTWEERKEHLLNFGASPEVLAALHAYETNAREAFNQGASQEELERMTDEFNALATRLVHESMPDTWNTDIIIVEEGDDIILHEGNVRIFYTWEEREKHLLSIGVSPEVLAALHAYETSAREAFKRGASQEELKRMADEFNESMAQLANDSINEDNRLNQSGFSDIKYIWASCSNGVSARWYRPGGSNYSEFVAIGGTTYGLDIPSGSGWVTRTRSGTGSWEAHIAWSTFATPFHDYASCN